MITDCEALRDMAGRAGATVLSNIDFHESMVPWCVSATGKLREIGSVHVGELFTHNR